MAEGSWFVYRSPYEGPSGRRVRRLPDASPLAWFQRMWQTTADEDSFDRDTDAYDWVDANLEADLGGRVYGLNSVFCAVDDDGDQTPADADRPSLWADRGGPFPASTWQELEGLLRRHLYVEGDPSDQIRVDEHSVRAATDDDEVDLAYYFLDDALAASDQPTYLMLEGWRLPATRGTDGHGFDESAGVQRLTARHGGTGATYVVMLSPGDLFDRRNLVPPSALVGVRLPELAPYLRSVRPGDADPGWPYSLLTLRSLVAPADRRIGPSLRRYTRSVGRLHHNDETIKRVWRSATEDHATAYVALQTHLQRPPSGRGNGWSEPDAARSRVSDTKHVAQALVHVHELFGYEQWYLFDDVWAAGHPQLASSLLRYASSWDPFDAAS